MKNSFVQFSEQHLIHIVDILRELVIRDLKVKYKRSVLGFAWTLVTPFVQLLVFYFVFRVLLSVKIPRFSSFAFCGLLAWNWFQASIFQSAGAITGNRELISRPGFPATILPVVTVLTNFLHFLVALPILILFLTLSGTIISSAILMLPILIIIQFIFILSLSYVVATLNVLFRDTQHILGILLQLLFFMTPIFYDASVIPKQYTVYYRLNPMVSIVESFRAMMMNGMSINSSFLWKVGIPSLLLLFLGHLFFIRMKYRFAEEL